MPDGIRVFLLDDHELLRRGLSNLINDEPDLEVVGQASTASAALAAVAASQPHVALLDLRLPDGDGVEVCREIRSQHPEVACVMLTTFSDGDAVFAAILAGATGYLLKHVRGEELVDGIRRVAAGESLLDPVVTTRVLDRLRHGETADPLATLTDQERRILDLIAEGLTNRQIGEQLFLAEKTIRNAVTGLLSKLGMQRRTQAAAFAARLAQQRQPGRASGGQ